MTISESSQNGRIVKHDLKTNVNIVFNNFITFKMLILEILNIYYFKILPLK